MTFFRVKGDLAESTMYYALKNYFALNGDDVLIVHSHKFLHKNSNNEKDFIVFNLSKGWYFLILHNKASFHQICVVNSNSLFLD